MNKWYNTDMFKVVIGDLFDSECDCIIVPVKPNMVLEGNIGGQCRKYLSPLDRMQIDLLKPVNFKEATLIHLHSSELLKAKAIILVANTWKSNVKTGKIEITKKALFDSYVNCLRIASQFQFKSVATAALSTGLYGISFKTSFEQAIKASKQFDGNEDILMTFYLASKETFDQNKALICKNIGNDEVEVKKQYIKDNEMIDIERAYIDAEWYRINEYGYASEDELSSFRKIFLNEKNKFKKDYGENNLYLIYEGLLPRSSFYAYLNGNTKLNRKTVIGMCINMQLDLNKTNQILSTFTYELRNSYLFDSIIIECFQKKELSRHKVNERLEDANLEPLFKGCY